MSNELPYRDLRVLEFSQGYAAPYCAMMLAQYGAEVIKLEPPRGDWSRGVGKPAGDHTALSIVANIGKKNLALDLKSSEGKALAKRLADESDVVVEAGRPGVAARLGLDYAAVRADNPGVIYVSVSGFGQTGPYIDRPGTDIVLQSFSGMMSANIGPEDGIPHRTGHLTVDHTTGLYAFQAVAAALYGRRDSGEGRFIDVSLMTSTASLLAPMIVDYHLQDGTPRIANAPTGSYQTKDGWVAFALIKEEHWARLCQCLARDDLAADPRYRTFASRAENLEALMPILRAILRLKTTAEWKVLFEQHDLLFNPINNFGDWLADEQVHATGAAPLLTQPHAGPTPIVQIPGTAPLTDGDPRGQAPRIGAHSREILARLGLDDAEIEGLAAKGVTRLADET